MHKILFYKKFIICLYMFRALCAIHQEVKIVLDRVIQKGGFNFVRLYFLNYIRYLNDLRNIWKRKS